MSTEALNRIIKEVNALTPQERRELIDRLVTPAELHGLAIIELSKKYLKTTKGI